MEKTRRRTSQAWAPLSTVVISFRIKAREALPLKAAFIQECSRG